MKFISYIKKRLIYADKYRVYSKKKFPLNIEVGTNSVCNGLCRICPYTSVRNNLPKERMSDELFKKIIDECSNHKVGYISPFLFNEPLTDPKIFDKINYIAFKIPNAKIIVATNAGLLDSAKAKKLIKVLREKDIVSFSF